ncbi:uncharacterized protein BKA78DRAFT_319145 [Phyllosticta capitalensis]|uniref:uncharacterized protein n=1 Tax=Phyllosticta capitalensis TaxID=121624 RepID=UPI0031322026
MSDQNATPEESLLEPPTSTLGLHQVYPDSSVDTDDATIDIVAVHGLGGDSFSTFTKNDCLWIRDLLPSVSGFENTRIMTFGYKASVFLHPFAEQTRGRTFTFAEDLLNELVDNRSSPKERERPIVFLGHSLGGIVIKSALRHAHERYSVFGDILDSTNAIIFFGTPHQGSDLAKWASILNGLGKAFRVRNSAVVEELKRWSNPLNELTTTFSELAERFQITTYFETKPTNGILVVPEGSARMGQKHERISGLEADHRGVCKFSAEESNWNRVSARLRAIARDIRQRVDLAFPTVPAGLVNNQEKHTRDQSEGLFR